MEHVPVNVSDVENGGGGGDGAVQPKVMQSTRSTLPCTPVAGQFCEPYRRIREVLKYSARCLSLSGEQLPL